MHYVLQPSYICYTFFRQLWFIYGKGYVNWSILILSDSQAALKALDSPVIKSKLVWDCLESLWTLVPGHKGILGNEMADLLAKMGSETKFIRPEPYLVCHTDQLDKMLKNGYTKNIN